ncbi:MAG: M20/M25/M40 family metallo-hydrolase, partial [Clostridia bacterium]|nr:M20/M25/M40 family metallo-hydrolase [Clostridia bacterium]
MENWIETHYNEHLKLLSDIAAIPAPSGHEDERVAFLMKWLVDNGFECHSDSAKNVIIPLCTAEDMDITCYCAHTDVVFPDTSALPVHAENGRLYAPGVGDDTANVAAILTMLKYIKEHELNAKTPVLFVLNSCEEGLGNLKGIRRIMSDFNGRIKEVVSFDCYLDGGMVTRAVGSERWRITAHTIGGHSFSA